MVPSKTQLRQEMKARRTAMSAKEVGHASDLMRVRLNNLEQVQKAALVFCYVSVRNEPDTRNLIHDLLDAGKHVCIPRLDTTGQMHAHRIQSLNDLLPSDSDYFHIPVPPADAPIEDHPNLVIVPGLAFTETGQRLGMGGGHYDRYLADRPDTVTVGLCYGWQVLEELPCEPHDRRVQMIVTDQRVFTIH